MNIFVYAIWNERVVPTATRGSFMNDKEEFKFIHLIKYLFKSLWLEIYISLVDRMPFNSNEWNITEQMDQCVVWDTAYRGSEYWIPKCWVRVTSSTVLLPSPTFTNLTDSMHLIFFDKLCLSSQFGGRWKKKSN